MPWPSLGRGCEVETLRVALTAALHVIDGEKSIVLVDGDVRAAAHLVEIVVDQSCPVKLYPFALVWLGSGNEPKMAAEPGSSRADGIWPWIGVPFLARAVAARIGQVGAVREQRHAVGGTAVGGIAAQRAGDRDL